MRSRSWSPVSEVRGQSETAILSVLSLQFTKKAETVILSERGSERLSVRGGESKNLRLFFRALFKEL